MSKPPPRNVGACPNCYGEDIRPIIYGYADYQLAQRAEATGAVLGGCCPDVDRTHQCAGCGHSFSPEVDTSEAQTQTDPAPAERTVEDD
eukprot:m.422688 g.422688  ORF g.422688 m.422688 type:complete len:89 (+) comp20202_c4_seq3:480-746(+)